MKAESYRTRSFTGVIIAWVVARTKTEVTYLRNQVSFIDCKTIPAKDFDKLYSPVKLMAEAEVQELIRLARYAVVVGMTEAAAKYLPKLTPMTKDDIDMAVAKGKTTKTKIQKDAAAEEAKDIASGKAPRKLSGAALASANAKAAKEAAALSNIGAYDDTGTNLIQNDALIEGHADWVDKAQSQNAGENGNGVATTSETIEPTTGKPVRKPKPTDVVRGLKNDQYQRERREGIRVEQLAAEVSADLTAAEASGTVDDPRLDKIKKPPKLSKKQVAKTKLVERKDGFDVEKLKNADGQWKSASSAFKGLIFQGGQTDDQIFKAVQDQFGIADDKRSYVNWNRGWFAKAGIEVPAAK